MLLHRLLTQSSTFRVHYCGNQVRFADCLFPVLEPELAGVALCSNIERRAQESPDPHVGGQGNRKGCKKAPGARQGSPPEGGGVGSPLPRKWVEPDLCPEVIGRGSHLWWMPKPSSPTSRGWLRPMVQEKVCREWALSHGP